MSQPEMQPEESAWGKEIGEEDPPATAVVRRAATHRRNDLSTRQFPLGDWGEPAERLEELYRWSEERAVEAIEWYRRDRVWKRRWARLLRFGTAGFAVAGVTAPLVDLAGSFAHGTGWGYVGLALAAACHGADRAFGLTSGWMRDVSTGQALQRRLEAFQFDWASECVREVLGPTEGTAGEAAERCLGVLRRFCEDISDMVRTETAEWMLEFRASMTQLPTQAPGSWGGRSEPGVGAQVRVLPPPGTRPTMPRQRPPEGPLR
ncbi:MULTISPECIES: SLATT domain-containing protein [unclassified Streptomyces]|uniref:SLATT domain-containing protein n=1 Tax=unclassified Streptomyces TaxID=2593676 RepID=UPI00211BB812|nr:MULTISPECIES: SLATT domain-containing protein [unclassified Streptomyces]